MAPEVIENKQYTLKADVFSYGIIIWEILTRKTPYADMSQQQISFYVTVKKGRPDKSIIPHNTPPAVRLF
jgi:serine/threonine protein kinase